MQDVIKRVSTLLSEMGHANTVKNNYILTDKDVFYAATFEYKSRTQAIKIHIHNVKTVSFPLLKSGEYNYKLMAERIVSGVAESKKTSKRYADAHTARESDNRTAEELSKEFADVAIISTTPENGKFSVHLKKASGRMSPSEITAFLTEYRSKMK